MSVSAFDDKPWHSRRSPLARSACAVYTLLLIYSGLAPWSGWRDLGLNPFAYLTAPIPAHVTTFDLLVNVLAYLPFGALLVLALHPAVRGWTAVLIAFVSGLLLASLIEAAQSWLPSRISSNLDLTTNTAGAMLGALVAAPMASSLIDRGRLADWRMRWFDRRASVMLLVIALWPVAQIYPEAMLFGNGDLSAELSQLFGALGGSPASVGSLFDAGELVNRFGVPEFVLAEAFVVAAAILAVGLAFVSTMRPRAPRVRLLLGLLLAALLAKALASAVQFGPERAFAWLTPGAYGGLALGVLSLLAASAGPRIWSVAVSLLATVALVIAVNVVPDNPFYLDAIGAWRQGKLTNFNALAHWLSLLWPYALLIVLISGSGRGSDASL